MLIKITSGTPSLCCSANANKTESKWNSFASDIFLFLPVFSSIRRNKDEIVAFVCKIWTHSDFCCHNRNFSTLVAERNTRLLASHTHIHTHRHMRISWMSLWRFQLQRNEKSVAMTTTHTHSVCKWTTMMTMCSIDRIDGICVCVSCLRAISWPMDELLINKPYEKGEM